MRGIESQGMVLCASMYVITFICILCFSQYVFFSDDPKQVQALIPPEGSVPGERVYVENYEEGNPDEVLNPKKKIWEKLQQDLKTNSEYFATWQGNALLTKSQGKIRSFSMAGAPIK